MITRPLIAYHREYLRALGRPPDARLKGLMSYCLLAERQEQQAIANGQLAAQVVVMQARYLRGIIEAGRADVARIVAGFGAATEEERHALLEQARSIQAAVVQAAAMLAQLEKA